MASKTDCDIAAEMKGKEQVTKKFGLIKSIGKLMEQELENRKRMDRLKRETSLSNESKFPGVGKQAI